MSRYCGENTVAEPILNAAEHWKTTSLLSDGSVFGSKEIWKIDYLQELNSIVEKLENRNFYDNLETRLKESGRPEIIQLAAEIFWFVHLCPSTTSISTSKKRERTKSIWRLSEISFPEDSEWLRDDILGGIGHPGQSFIARRQSEWVFFTQFMIAFKKLPAEQRTKQLSNGWKFAEWLEEIPENENRALRHMILFLLFPENFERIFSRKDRRKIISKFTKEPVGKLSVLEMDQHIF